MRAFCGRDLRRLLLASTALVLPFAGAQAQDATWSPVPTVAGPTATTFDFNASPNWVPATVPTGTASFDVTTGPSLSFSAASTTLGTFQFTPLAPAYTFNLGSVSGNTALTLTGSGIVNNSANAPTFAVGQPGGVFGTLTFQNSSTAANANLVLQNGILNFQDNSDAGTAIITMPNQMFPGHITFSGSSSAANANITNNSTIPLGNVFRFLDMSTAGNATINNIENTSISFAPVSLEFGLLNGADTSNAGTAHITNNNNTVTSFFASTSAANATVVNNSGGSTVFEDTSTFGNANITNNGGNTTVCGACSGGMVSAGTATISNTNNGRTIFGDTFLASLGFPETSTAANATITNDTGGSVQFYSATTAGNANITNNSGGTTIFGLSSQIDPTLANIDTATAGDANIINNNGGATNFFALTTAGSATVTTNSGGSVSFFDQSTGGNARFITNAGGTFDMSGLATTGMTAGSIEGAGNYFLGSKNLSVGGNNLSTTVSGVIADGGASGGTGGSLTLTGSGTLTLTGANTYTGGTFLNGGTIGIGNNQALGTGALAMADGTALQAAGNGFNVGNNIAITGTGTVDTNGFGLTLSGIIADGASAGGLTQTGAGTLTLTGINTYTGTTIVNGGTLALAGNGSIVNSAVGVQSGTFDISQTNAGASINGLFGSPFGVTALGSRTLTITNGSLYPGIIQDGGIGGGTGGGVTIAGGEQVLLNTNTYTGVTTINPGAQLTLSSFSFPPFFSSDGSISNSSHVIDNGVFDIGNLSNGGTSIRSLAGNGGVGLGSNTLTLTAASDTFSGAIGGGGGVTLTGGTQTLSGNNTYTGATNVNGGVLSLTGTLGNTAMNVADGATFQGTGASAGSVTIQNGGNLAPGVTGVNNGIGTLTMAGLTLMSGANLNYDLSTPNVIGGTTNDRIQDNGQLTLGGTLHVNTLAGFGAGSYRIIDYTGALSNPSGLGVALPSGFNGVIQTAIPGQVNLIVASGASGPVQFWDGATTVGDGVIHGGTGTWTNASNNTNWTDPNGNINQSWLSGFGIFAANPGTVTVADTIHYTGLQFSTNGYVVNASGGGTLNPTGQATIRVDNGVTTMIGAPIVGIGGLVVSGPGTLVLTANNAFSGGTTLAGGTLQIGNGATSATLGGDISITGTNTVLRFNQNIALFGGSITETAGASTSLSFAGAQTVLNGPVKLTNSGNAASSVAAGATLQTNNTFALAGGLNLDGAITFAGPSASIAGAITGTGLVQQSGGTTTFTAGTSPTNYTGPTLVSGGTLIAGAANSFSPVSAMSVGSSTVDLGGFAQAINAVALNGGTLQNGGLTGAVTSTGGTINGIGGPAGVTTTSGLTTFSGTNTYTGATHINGGTARGGNANGFSAGSPTSIAGGATLDLGGFAQTINSVALGGGTLQNGALTGAVTSTGGLISGIGGPASVTTTSGVTTFTGATYTGATNINGGTARGGSTNGFSTASRTIIAGGATLDLGGFNQAIASIGGSGTIGNTGAAAATLTTGTSASSVFSGTIIDDAATALTKVGSGTLTLSGANTYSGGTLLNAGTLGIGNSKAFGTGALSMATFTTLQAAGNGFNVANAIALAGADTIDTNGFALTLSGVISGSGSPAITGGGTLTLINANTYAGGTFVNAGTLGIGNGQALGTGAVSMADGTILQAAGNGFNVANAISLAGTGTIDTNGFGLTLSGVLGGTGGLTKIGVGTLTLTGADAYTGPTIINAGALYVDGSIVSPSTVNASGVLGGSGRLGAVTVAGGTLAPGSQGAIGTLTIIGPLGFSASSFYNVRITPTANDQTNVSGTVSPGGASVSLSAAGGSYTLGRRTIVTAGSVNGTFNANVNTPTALAFIRPMLAYDATHVYLDLVGNAPSGAVDYRTAALTYNQFRVATGLTNAAALNPGGVGGIIVGALNGLSTGQAPAVFDSLSGAGIAATQNVAFDASKLFTSAMSDQGRYWREGGPDVSGITVGEVPSFYASTRKGPFDVAVAPPPPPRTLERTWRAWFTGFGQGETVHSQLPLGTSRQDNSLYGGAGGLDYQLMPNTLIGVAAGGSSARFSVPSLATSGSVDGGHIGIYGVTTLGPFYAQSSSTLSVFRNHETRNVTPFGGLNGETERGDFTSKELRSRLEFGRKFIWADFSVTPFAAMEIAKLWSNAFTETGNAGGPGLLTLSVPAASHVSAPAFVGARFEKAFILANGWVFTPSASLAYVHEFSPLRDQFGALAFLPASAFVVDGARPASHAAQVKTGAQLALNSWAAVYADFEGEFSNRAQTYAGKGGVKVSW